MYCTVVQEVASSECTWKVYFIGKKNMYSMNCLEVLCETITSRAAGILISPCDSSFKYLMLMTLIVDHPYVIGYRFKCLAVEALRTETDHQFIHNFIQGQ